MEKIIKRDFSDTERATVQDSAIASVTNDPEAHFQAYSAIEESYGGRYVAADLFKETFPEYSASNDGRNWFNSAVHNSAAVLSSEQFNRALTNDSEPKRDVVIFLTGIPGAGKTSSILRQGGLPPDARVVFEGQLSRPASVIPKIQKSLDAGLKPVILAVHAKTENALDNTIVRFNTIGRGASLAVMAEIQGGLPSGLEQVRAHFGDKVKLVISDVRDRSNTKVYSGWDKLPILSSEGTTNEITAKLSKHLNNRYDQKSITTEAYRHASGQTPIRREPNQLARRDERVRNENDAGQDISPANRSENILTKALRVESKDTTAQTIANAELGKSEHLVMLKNNPAFKNHANHDIEKIAQLRSLLAEGIKTNNPEQLSARLESFDDYASKPDFLNQLRVSEKAETKQVDERITPDLGHSL